MLNLFDLYEDYLGVDEGDMKKKEDIVMNTVNTVVPKNDDEIERISLCEKAICHVLDRLDAIEKEHENPVGREHETLRTLVNIIGERVTTLEKQHDRHKKYHERTREFYERDKEQEIIDIIYDALRQLENIRSD